MRRAIALTILCLTILTSAVRAQTLEPANPMVLAGRIIAIPNLTLYRQHRDADIVAGNTLLWPADTLAAVRADAEERLSVVIEEFREQEPLLYQYLMTKYQLRLTDDTF